MDMRETATRIVTLADEISRKASDLMENGDFTPAFEHMSGQAGANVLDDAALMLSRSERLYRLRRRRERIFEDESLFTDPAWDILLELFAAHLKGKKISITSAGLAANVPPTTGLRWINVMEQARLLERERDEQDARRTFIRLTPHAIEKLTAVLAEFA